MSKVLPNNWVATLLSELLISLESGSRPRGGVRGITQGVPSVGGEHLKYDGTFDFSSVKFVPREFADKMTKGRIKIGDILVVKDGATTGKTSFVDSGFPFKNAVVNEHVFICRPNASINPIFLFRFMASQEGQNRILENFKGSAQGGINKSFVANTQIPVPPIFEQHRIVEKLQKLLSKIDDSQRRLIRIPIILKRFRQSILNAACTGKLTVDLRGFDELSSWEQVKLSDVIEDKPKNGYSAKPVQHETSYRVLTLTATTSGKFYGCHFKYFDEHIPSDSPLWLSPGDILVQRGNTIEYVGVPAVYNGQPNEYVYPDLMIKFRANSKVLTEYLYFVLSWGESRKYLRQRATGTAGNMPKINQSVLIDLPIPLPPLKEQKDIIARVITLFELLDNIELRYFKAKKHIDSLSQSILAKAFRGELVS